MPFASIGTLPALAADWTAARAALVDRLAIIQAGGAGELTLAGAALIPRLSLLAAGGAGELTIARAALLSNLDAAVSGRLGAITSIQTLAATIAPGNTFQDTAITAVVLARTMLLFLGLRCTAGTFTDALARAFFTSTTNVRVERIGTLLLAEYTFSVVQFAA